ncbi:helix-turn-helix transcriptional regulator [Bradyrhizobium neotropicale]|uniref:helix-turn-helix transcriptional regulator n=1 Tax=Bradyrhizobium neotropicale TaxID=1497615 RepID=UPI001AD6C82C|nr:helix-turn-helix transcriptional regulator [Bradyrhizobium neotropicale]MBO4226642.1 DNA-binding protein [Bradyrhizobium neotropicale]
MEPFDRQRITHALSAAAVDPSLWTMALETVAACTGSYGVAVFPVAGPLPFLSSAPSMEESFDVYVRDGWINRDERYRGVAKFIRNGVATDDDCVDAEVRKRSPYYQEFLRPCGFTDWAGVRIGRGDLVWNLSIQRTSDQGPFSNAELNWLARISNALDSIVQTSVTLGMAKGEAALHAFDFSDQAAILLDRRGSVVRPNAAAERMIGEDLQISAGKVVCSNAPATDRLNRAIKALLWSQQTSTTPPVVFPKASGGKLVIYPMRLPGLTNSPLSAFHAILVIADTDAADTAATTTLRDAFDLTAAEARLAIAIATGKDLDSFSVERQISKETVRNQLKSIFLKTGTNRQAQLAVTLATLIPNR